jgi:hypothetical protein
MDARSQERGDYKIQITLPWKIHPPGESLKALPITGLSPVWKGEVAEKTENPAPGGVVPGSLLLIGCNFPPDSHPEASVSMWHYRLSFSLLGTVPIHIAEIVPD